ncbi:MAG: hypothetical protein DI570_04080 [Phenylobacterium zucineum]|nr:MAG: hypothetical protein DI570_04080 [Phenylobacterium zucineum]
MKRAIFSLAAAAVLAAPFAAQAAPWQSINQRQDALERRIDQGVRTGDLNRREAQRLREQFRDLTRLEHQYRRSGGGISISERRDLDQRFDRLSQRIYAQRNDHQRRY